MSKNRHVQAAVVWADEDSASIRQRLTNRESDLKAALNPPQHDGNQCYPCAFSKALSALGDGRSSDPRRTAIVWIGGWPGMFLGTEYENDDWVRGTSQAKAAGAKMVVACAWLKSCIGGQGFNWERYASPGFYIDAHQSNQLKRALKEMVDESLSQASNLAVYEVIPTDLAFVPDSAQPPPSLIDTARGRLRWDFQEPITRTITLTYRVQPLGLGTYEFTGGQAVITDTQRPMVARTIPFPTGAITVSDPCLPPTETPSPTPTDMPIPTATDTLSPTLTPTDTPSPTATRTLPPSTTTPTPAALYLPLVLREQCVPDYRRVDVVLAIDASTSMDERTPAGRSKLAAAIEAARGFLGELRFERGDQAAIVAFNASATLVQPLTGDRTVLEQALAGIRTAQQTCLVCAVEAGWAELASSRHVSGHAAVLVLLTDGRSNPRPASEAVARAAAAKAAGVAVFTIGLGADVDAEALAAIASRREWHYGAPDGEALAEIYRAIAVALPCSAVAFWGGR